MSLGFTISPGANLSVPASGYVVLAGIGLPIRALAPIHRRYECRGVLKG